MRQLARAVQKKIPERFDITIFLRYKPVIEEIMQRGRGKNFKICEVGSGSWGIGPYLKKDFYGIDLSFSKEKSKYLKGVKGSATQLPKAWNSKFDYVISVDMLEHLAEKDRGKAISEMIRLSRKYVFILFPAGKLARITDKILDKYYLFTHKEKLNYLKEHFKQALPDLKMVKQYVYQSGADEGKFKEIKNIKVLNNSSCLVYLSLLMLGFSQNKLLTRLYGYSYFIRNVLAKINIFPYRKVLLITLK